MLLEINPQNIDNRYIERAVALLKKGAIIIKESELDSNFEPIFSNLISNENLQKELSENIKKLAKPNATKDIVEQIVKLIK